MKKSIISMSLLVILLTGCGEKKLICTYSNTDSYAQSIKVNTKVVFDKNDKIKSLSFDNVFTYTDKYIKQEKINLDDQLSSLDETCKEAQASGVTCKAQKISNGIKTTMKYDFIKMTDEDKKEYNLTEISNNSYKDMKKLYEEGGYTCK